MRLWSYQLIPVLPNKMLISQWRECIAIKRQWEKGTLKHRLVSYVKDYNKEYFMNYIDLIMDELSNRNIKFQYKYGMELRKFCNYYNSKSKYYSEHNERYLKQCLYNLQEKADKGIITQEEWQKIEDKFGDVLND